MKTVLLAYERDQDLSTIETFLSTHGFRIVKARSGIEAIDIVRRDAPHFVVSDVLLPRLDGFALCRRIKEDPTLQHVPVLLFSTRVEGPKYEAFAAEVGADRFLAKGSTLEDLVTAIADAAPGSGTMRMPALVPELIEKREQDRRKIADVEKQIHELEAANSRLADAERAARERAEREARARSEFAASESQRIKELQNRIRDLETAQQHLVQAESKARNNAEESRADSGKLALLESRLTEVQNSRLRIQSAAADTERLFMAQPVPTWLCDMETRKLQLANDAAAALFGTEGEKLRGRTLGDLLPGFEFGEDVVKPLDATIARPDGTSAVLEIRRRSVSYSGRAHWLITARDVTTERVEQAHAAEFEYRARALQHLPAACCIADREGRLRYANPAFLKLLSVEADRIGEISLSQLEVASDADATARNPSLDDRGPPAHVARWRRPDGALIDVDVAVTQAGEPEGLSVVTVQEVTGRLRNAERNERDSHRVVGLLELTQRAHSLTESEIQAHALELVQELTGSPAGYVFLALPDAAQLELASRRGGEASPEALSMISRWRGQPPGGTALFECFSTQRPVVREVAEETGALRAAGLPASLRRQLATPIAEGGRLVGVLLMADKPEAYDDDDRRHAAQISDGLWKLMRRRRSDAEVVSAMDHMERVMFGAIETLASLSESQDGCKIGRSRRVAELAAGIGVALGLPGHTVRGLRVIAQLIDVGMLQIPRELLWRPGTLTAAEFDLVKTHAERGAESLKRIEFPWPVADAVRQHHERLDGSGYPRGMKGEEILFEARIVAVADAVEAMLSPRPQRAALSLNACIEELQLQAGRRYDARVVKAAVNVLRDRAGPAGTLNAAVSDQRIA
jgi:PAS domain S-box-containing protein